MDKHASVKCASAARRRAQRIRAHLAGVGRSSTSGSGSLVPSSGNATTSPYKFTANGNGLLTEEQRDFYEKNGYVIVKKLLNEQELKAYEKRFKAICNQEVEVGRKLGLEVGVGVAWEVGLG